MKTLKNLTIILVVLLSASFASSGWVTLTGSSRELVEPSVLLSESSTSAVRFEVILPGFSVNEIEYDETTYHQLSLPGYGTTIDEGEPALPVISVLVALPDDATVSSTPTVSIHTETTFEDYYIYPVEGTTDHPEYETGAMVNTFTINDDTGETYATDAFYPENLQLELLDDGYLYEQRLAVVSFCPFQFNPQTEELRVITQATIEISYSPTGVSWNTTGAGPLHKMLEDLCLNYNWDGNVSAPTAPNPTSSGSLYWFDDSWDDDDLEEQRVDYLVIVAKKFENMISSDTSIDVIGQYLDDLLRWRSTDANSPDNFDIMIARLDDLVPYMSDETPAEERTDSTNLRVGELLDQFIEKIYETTSADHINGGSLEYVLFVGDAHVDGNFNNTPRAGGGDWGYDYNITSFTMNSPDYDTDIPTVMYDVEGAVSSTWGPGIGKYWYPWFTDIPYADVDEGDFYEDDDHTFPGRNIYHGDDYLGPYDANFTADPELDWPELITARITADEELATDDNIFDNRTAVQVMSDICEKILDFEKNPPVEITGNYHREICIYDGTNDGLVEARDRTIGTYLESDDRYWDQHGYDVNYLVGWEHSGTEHSDGTVTDEITELFAPSIGRSGELIFVYQNHGGVRSWNPILKDDPSELGPVPVFIFTNDDVDLLDNGPFYPLVFSLCCTTGHFCEDRLEDIGDPITVGSYNERTQGCDDNRNIAETLLRDADGGAMGVWAATSSTGRHDNYGDVNVLAEYMNQNGDVSFGELCTHLRFSGSSSLLSDSNFLKYITFGDPALHVTDQWREPSKPDLMVNWGDVRFNDNDNGDISDNHYPYLHSGSDAELTAYVQVKNIGLSDSNSTTATFRFYSTVGNLGQPTLLDTISGVTVDALSAGASTEISASYDDFIGDYGSDPGNGIWRDSIDRNIRFHFTCEVDPSDNIDESVEDNNTVAWPDDNVMSYNPNPDWEFDPEDEDDDVTQDPFIPLDELWFFPNMAGFPDKVDGANSSAGYVVVADINQDGQQQGLVILDGRPYLIDDSGIDETTSFVGLNDDVILSIAVGDIAGDSDLEIVGISSQKLFVWNGDGSLLDEEDWPIVLTGDDRFIPHLIVSDFDADSKAEIGVIVKVSSGIEVRAYVFNGDFEFETLNGATECVGISSGNIDGNPGNEYIVIEGNLSPSANNTVYKLYAWDSDFNSVLAADSYTIGSSGKAALICDYDDDGTTEIMLTEDLSGTLTGQAYNTSSASAETGTDAFKAELDAAQTVPWIAAELVSGNTKPEFLTTIRDDDKLGQMYLSAGADDTTHYDPLSDGYTASSVYSPILADLDDDGNVDIALSCGNGYIYFRKAEFGTEELDDLFTTDLRLYIPEELDADYSEYVKHLALADLDDDGDYEIIAVSNLGHVFVWETDCDDASSIQWEQYPHDAGHRNYADEY